MEQSPSSEANSHSAKSWNLNPDRPARSLVTIQSYAASLGM